MGVKLRKFYHIRLSNIGIPIRFQAIIEINTPKLPFIKYSVVVFYGSCRLKNINNVPINCQVVYPENVTRYVKSVMKSAMPAPYTDKWEIMRLLKSSVENGNDEIIRTAHMQKVRQVSYGRYQSTYSYDYMQIIRSLKSRIRRF